MGELIAMAGSTEPGDVVTWQGTSASHRFTVLRASAAIERYTPVSDTPVDRIDDFDPLVSEGPRRIDVPLAVEPFRARTVSISRRLADGTIERVEGQLSDEPGV
jgi:hypothetical protein